MNDPPHPFDRATALDPTGKNSWTGVTSEDYWAFVGPFGGVLSALLLRSVLEHPDRLGRPLALTVNFCAPLAKGAFGVSARPVRTNRSSQHWSVTLTQGADIVLTATVVTALRPETWSHQPRKAPQAPQPDGIEPYRMAPGGSSWIGRYEFRFASGAPRIGRADMAAGAPLSPYSLLWLRDEPPRPLDYLSLAAMADAFFGRIFHALGRLTPFGTVSLTTYFLADEDEIARQGRAAILGVADASRFHRAYGDQAVEMWGRDGTLLATSTQVAYFRA